MAGLWNHGATPKIRGGQSARGRGPCKPIAMVLERRTRFSRMLPGVSRSLIASGGGAEASFCRLHA
jgi:hypothetical protein